MLKSRLLPYFSGAMTALIVLAGVYVLDRSAQIRFQQENRANVLQELSAIRARLEGALNSRLFLTQGLIAHVSNKPNIDVPEFQNLAGVLVAQKTGIRSIQLAKNTVVSHVYPLQGNERAVGLKILEHPKQWQAARRAIDTRRTVVAGPVDLVQRGVAFISRTPIFLTPPRQAPGSGPYWGLATLIIMRDALFEEAGLIDGSATLRYALRGKDGLGASGDVFFGDAAIFQSSPVALDVSLPNGSWQLAGIPVGGWSFVAPGSWWLRIGGGLLAVLAGVLVGCLARVPAQLRETVERATTALRESEERYALAVRGANDGLWDWNLKTNQVHFSPRWKSMLGYEESEVGSSPDEWFKRVHPADIERVRAEIAVHLEGLTNHFEHEHRMLHKDGTVRWVFSRGIATRDPSGEVSRMAGTQTDITDRKQAEEALRQSEEQLRQSQKMEAVGQLAGGVAHDFNNLLTVIIGRAQLLLARLHERDPLLRDLRLIQKTAERAAVLTRQLGAFSRKQVLQPKVLDLNAVIADIETMLRRLIGEDIDLVIVRDSNLGPVKADPGQIEQVLMNLVVNARDAMPQGGTLTIRSANVELNDAFARRHPGTRPGHYVMLVVSDTGCGMDAETQARIFEPFFTTKAPGKGTGLGLTTVYGIVAQSGGQIEVESAPGHGAVFRIYLPRVEEPVEVTGPDAAFTELPRGSETVLLVEDEEALRDLAREVLQQNGYAVLEARHGGEALLISERHRGPIHLLVTDVVMPQMNGPEVARRLAPAHPEMKVLYMSGYADRALGHQDSGAALLQKPFTPGTLARTVREILDPVPQV